MDPRNLFLTQVVTGEISDPELDRHLARQTLLANGALLDLSEGLIQPADFLDVLEFAGHDMDSTIALFEDNVIQAGYW